MSKIGIKISKVELYTHIARVPRSRKAQTNKLPILYPTYSSSYLKSLVSLLIILPIGILLKKLLRLA